RSFRRSTAGVPIPYSPSAFPRLDQDRVTRTSPRKRESMRVPRKVSIASRGVFTISCPFHVETSVKHHLATRANSLRRRSRQCSEVVETLRRHTVGEIGESRFDRRSIITRSQKGGRHPATFKRAAQPGPKERRAQRSTVVVGRGLNENLVQQTRPHQQTIGRAGQRNPACHGELSKPGPLCIVAAHVHQRAVWASLQICSDIAVVLGDLAIRFAMRNEPHRKAPGLSDRRGNLFVCGGVERGDGRCTVLGAASGFDGGKRTGLWPQRL